MEQTDFIKEADELVGKCEQFDYEAVPNQIAIICLEEKIKAIDECGELTGDLRILGIRHKQSNQIEYLKGKL